MLALSAAGPLKVVQETTISVAFSWSSPGGYYDGFRVYGVASSLPAVDCKYVLNGKNCLQLRSVMFYDSVYIEHR